MTMPPPPPPPPDATGGAPATGQNSNVREHPDGTTILVLGILGIVVCGLLAPVAWVKGNRALREIDAQPNVNWTNRGAVQAGRICGIIGSVLIALGVLAILLLVSMVAVGSG